MSSTRYTDYCNHSEGSFVGYLGRFDVYVDTDRDGSILTCLRYGDEGHEYISGGGSDLQDVRSLVRNLISEHVKQMEDME